MTGPNGFEDYTYSNYFLGRSEFEGFESQQIMMRDGGFKVRTDLLSDKVAKTDDWLIATNFTTSIPNGVLPGFVMLYGLQQRQLLPEEGTDDVGDPAPGGSAG